VGKKKLFTKLHDPRIEVNLTTKWRRRTLLLWGINGEGWGARGEEVLAVIDERINSCARFAECRCPIRLWPERVYLIPQALDAST